MTASDAQHGGDTNTAYQSTDNRNASDPIHLSHEQQDKISRLLEVAEVHLMVGRITEPPGSNAYDAYKQVLEIDPNNPQAKAGLFKIADHYEKLARESLKSGDSLQRPGL